MKIALIVALLHPLADPGSYCAGRIHVRTDAAGTLNNPGFHGFGGYSTNTTSHRPPITAVVFEDWVTTRPGGTSVAALC